MKLLIEKIIQEGILRTENIIDAFLKIEREDFVAEDLKKLAKQDAPLPIGFGQTISQPSTVAFMLELLALQKDQNILDVGSGSGWTTALLSEIVGKSGHVTAMETVRELCDLGRKNIDKYGFVKKGIAEVVCQSAQNGYLKNAPYERILVSATVKDLPQVFKEQLSINGKMVLPVGSEIWLVEKNSADDFSIKKFPGFVFVPFIMKS